jgi:Type II CAAX prenyl endopeptidase Rce1-like
MTSSARLALLPANYWRLAQSPRYSLSFAFPLLVAYEVLALLLSRLEMVRVRNGADVLLKQLFVGLGGRYGLAVFGLALVGGGAALIGRDIRRSGGIRPRYFVFMAAESIAYALVFGLVAGTLTGLLLPRLALAPAALGLPAQVMVSLGAGIYEELVFRVLLVSGLMLIARKGFGWPRQRASLFAVILGALIFSAFHYVGDYGERFTLGSFTFRAIAGLLFSALYLLRGFGITAWTHALYDIFLAF